MEENNIKKRNFRPLFIGIIIILLTVITILLYLNLNKKEETKCYITYVSISTKNDYAYLDINVETDKTITFYASDFAILKNNIPIKSDGIVTEVTNTFSPNGFNSVYTIGPSLEVKSSGIIRVSIDMKTSEITNETFLFKGQTLILGQKIEI